MGDNLNQFVEVRESAKHGNGLFALRDFKKGEKIYSFPLGKVVTSRQIRTLTKAEKDHLDKIGEDKYEIVQPPLCCVNHSCDPSIKEIVKKGARVGYAPRHIKKDEELTVDYDKTAYLEKPFECHCGSKNCRGFVRGRE